MNVLRDTIATSFWGFFVIWSIAIFVFPEFGRLVAPIDKWVWILVALYILFDFLKTTIRKGKEDAQLLKNNQHEQTKPYQE